MGRQPHLVSPNHREKNKETGVSCEAELICLSDQTWPQHGGMGDQMGGGHHQQHPGVHPEHSQGGFTHQDKMPFVKIIEQPAENKLRFR